MWGRGAQQAAEEHQVYKFTLATQAGLVLSKGFGTNAEVPLYIRSHLMYNYVGGEGRDGGSGRQAGEEGGGKVGAGDLRQKEGKKERDIQKEQGFDRATERKGKVTEK